MNTAHPTTATPDANGKSRIIHAALKMFSTVGFAATTTRKISAAAEVTPGLITHHFGTKAGLQQAVDDFVVQGIADAVAIEPAELADLAAADAQIAPTLDKKLADHLAANPEVVAYLRRAILITDAAASAQLISRIADIARRQVNQLRTHGFASVHRNVEEQVFHVLVTQLGSLFVEPLVAKIGAELNIDGSDYALQQRKKPTNAD